MMVPLEERNTSSKKVLKTITYVQNDFSSLNSFINALVEQDTAKVKQLHFKLEESKLRRVIIVLIISLLLSLSALIFLSIIKLQSLTIGTVNNTTLSDNAFSSTQSAAVKKLAQMQTIPNQPSDNQRSKGGVSQNNPKVLLDYTLFETVYVPAELFPNIQSVTTGFKFSNSTDKKPNVQHCYGTSLERYGNKFVTIALARYEKTKLKPATITNDELNELSLTKLEFNQLQNYCKFR